MKYAYEAAEYNSESGSTRGKYATPFPGSAASLAPVRSAAAPPTPSRDFGPFFVTGAPFRASLLPPAFAGAKPASAEQPRGGEWLVVRGVVQGTRGQHVPFAVLDVWQASPDARYDYRERDGVFRPYLTYIGELNTHSEAEDYSFRARVVADEQGRFEYHSVVPVPYLDPEDDTWRCPHVHHFVQALKHASCVTQIMFEGMERNAVDNHIRPELTYKLTRPVKNGTLADYWLAQVQFVLVEQE